MYTHDQIYRSFSCGNIDDKIIATNGGNIYLSGYQAASNFLGDSIIMTRNDSDIICSGRQSCMDQTLKNGNNIYCIANYACSNAKLIGNVNNLWAMGSQSACYTDLIENIYNNIYCLGYLSCCATSITNVANDIYGLGYKTLTSTVISNVGNNVQVIGYQIIYGGIITNVSNIVACIGESSCASAIFENIGKIYCYGSNCLSNATITSNRYRYHDQYNGSSLHELMIIINGNMTDNFEIYCSENDTCFIKCGLTHSCTKLNLYCYGECFVRCSTNRNINCPNAVIGDFMKWESMAPTNIPTDVPVSLMITTTTTPVTSGTAYAALVAEFDQFGTYVVFTFALIGLILYVIGFYHYRFHLKSIKKLIDRPRIECVFKCLHNICDLWTDILFVIILFLEKYYIDNKYPNLWMYSALFVLLPYILQCILSLWYLQKWQDRMSKISSNKLNNYPINHEWLLIALSMLFGFYATIELTRSKLFYLPIFHSQISNHYYQQIRWFRFINVVIIENIPQLIIQSLYIFGNFNETSAVVYLSMLFSILSIVLAFLTHLSFVISSSKDNYCNSGKYDYESNIKVKMIIKHSDLRLSHLFCNATMEGIFSAFLDHNKELKLSEKNSDDFKYSIETQYVESSKYNKGSITVNINVSLSTNDMTLVDSVSAVIGQCDTLSTLATTNPNSLQMKQLITNGLHLDSTKSIVLTVLPITSTDRQGALSVDLGRVSSVSSNSGQQASSNNINVSQVQVADFIVSRS